VRDSLAAGRVELKSDALNGCLNAMLAPDGTCSTYGDELPWLEACTAEVWVGKVAAGGACFFDALLGQVDIAPSGEKIGQVPRALTMARQHKQTIVSHQLFLRGFLAQ
jgi:hypothetical protein